MKDSDKVKRRGMITGLYPLPTFTLNQNCHLDCTAPEPLATVTAFSYCLCYISYQVSCDVHVYMSLALEVGARNIIFDAFIYWLVWLVWWCGVAWCGIGTDERQCRTARYDYRTVSSTYCCSGPKLYCVNTIDFVNLRSPSIMYRR